MRDTVEAIKSPQAISTDTSHYPPIQASEDLSGHSLTPPKTPPLEIDPGRRQHESQYQPSPVQLTGGSSLIPFMAGSYAGAPLLTSQASRKQYQAWAEFVARHRKVLDTRIKAEELRKSYSDRRANFSEAHSTLSDLLRILQSGGHDAGLQSRLLQHSYAVRKLRDDLDFVEKQVELVEKDLVQEESNLHDALPEFLRIEKDTEETVSSLRRRGFDFRGNNSHLTNSIPETSNGSMDLELDSNVGIIDMRLSAIENLETEILSLRHSISRIQNEILTDGGENSEASQTALGELDQHETKQNAKVSELKAMVASLEQLRDSDPFNEKSELEETKFNSAASHLTEGDKSTFARPRLEMMDDDAWYLFLSMRRRLHSQSMQNTPVFPTESTDTGNSSVDKFDLINFWLFHQLRTSDYNLGEYVKRLLKCLPIENRQSSRKILALALGEWHKDVLRNSAWSDQPPNDTDQTNLGSRFLSAASLGYQNRVTKPDVRQTELIPKQRAPRRSLTQEASKQNDE